MGERSAALHIVYEDGAGRVVVLDSLTRVDARLGAREGVDGIVSHANVHAAVLGVSPGARAAAAGRVVLLSSMSFDGSEHRRDVLCAGSHAGHVNVERLLEVRPHGAIFNDGGIARDRSGVSGLPALDAADVAAVAAGTMTARIGDPASTWHDGIVSVVNETARRAGVAPGQPAREAALLILERC